MSEGTAFLLFVGLFLGIVGWIWLVVVASRAGVLWGLATALFPMFAAPCLALDRWKETRLPMLIHYAGILMILIPGLNP